MSFTKVAPAGIGTEPGDGYRIGNSITSTIFYEADNATTISTTTTLSRASSNPGKIYTKFQEVVVGTAPGTVELIVGDGEEFVLDAYQLRVLP